MGPLALMGIVSTVIMGWMISDVMAVMSVVDNKKKTKIRNDFGPNFYLIPNFGLFYY